jgi:hypothetical protein
LSKYPAVHVTRFTDLYLDYAHEFTDCPDPFLLWGALLAISASLSRSVYVEAGSWNISPHIWVVLIGKSSSHKSTAITIVEDLIELVDPSRTAPHEFTSEAIIQSLSKSSNRLFIFDEAKSFFDMLSKKYNESLKSLFTILYRKPNYSRTTMKHGTLAISNAYLPMGLATTPDWLRQSLQDAEQSAMSGFLARFLLVPYLGSGNAPMALPPPHSPAKFEALVGRLKAFSLIEQVFHYSAEARLRMSAWYSEVTERENVAMPMLGPFFEHFKNEAIHKLSVLFAVDRGETEIGLVAFEEAAMCLRYLEDTLPDLVEDMTGSQWDRWTKLVAQTIQKKGHMNRTEILRLHRTINTFALTKILQGLVVDRKIKLAVTSEKDKSGRPPEIYEWIGD